MFKDVFIDLCNKNKVSPTSVCVNIGLSNAAFSAWKDDTVPRKATLLKIADYFGVSVDYLLGKEGNSESEDGLSDQQKELIAFARSVPDDKAELVLKLLRAILEDPK